MKKSLPMEIERSSSTTGKLFTTLADNGSAFFVAKLRKVDTHLPKNNKKISCSLRSGSGYRVEQNQNTLES